jgi:hypothetical protein
MNYKALIVAIVGSSLLIGPAFAGDRLDKSHENARICRGKVAAKHVPAANKQAELDKCAGDPQGYQ